MTEKQQFAKELKSLLEKHDAKLVINDYCEDEFDYNSISRAFCVRINDDESVLCEENASYLDLDDKETYMSFSDGIGSDDICIE